MSGRRRPSPPPTRAAGGSSWTSSAAAGTVGHVTDKNGTDRQRPTRIDFRAARALKDELDAMAFRCKSPAAWIAREGIARELERLRRELDGDGYRMCLGCFEWIERDSKTGEFPWHNHNGRTFKGE